MIPFSSGSGLFETLIRPRTPLTALAWLCGILFLISLSFAAKSKSILENGVVFVLQLGHASSWVVVPHLGQDLYWTVDAPLLRGDEDVARWSACQAHREKRVDRGFQTSDHGFLRPPDPDAYRRGAQAPQMNPSQIFDVIRFVRREDNLGL